jgi:hypothetical protein
MNPQLLLNYLDARRTTLVRLPEGAKLHVELLAIAPHFYAHIPADAAADLSHRREALANLLTGELTGERPDLLGLLRPLPLRETLPVLGVLAERRINCRRARRLGLALVLNHPDLPELAAARRNRLARLLRHLLGECSWSGVRRALEPQTNGRGQVFLEKLLGRYAPVTPAVREALAVLTGAPVEPTHPALRRRLAARTTLAEGEGLPRETLFGLRGVFHPKTPASQVRYLAAPVARAAADGPLTVGYKAALSGQAPSVPPEVLRGPDARPALPGRLAVVLDLSASTASSGERAYHPAALGLAVARQLQARVSDVSVVPVGGTDRPHGGTDLASAVLEAARQGPGAVLVVTDGYENTRPGDTAAVVVGLRRLGFDAPVLQVVPRFTPGEDLSRRRLGEAIPLLAVDHEGDVGELLARVVLAHAGAELAPEDLDQIETLLFVR